MKNLLRFICVGATLLFAVATLAAGQASPEEAKTMAIKAAEYLKVTGPAKAFPEFSAKDGPWHDRDLYVSVSDSKGVMLAHGDNAGLIGKSMLDLKDVDDKAFNRERLELKDSGWINYKWRNPVTKAIEPKTQYVIRVGDYLVGVGAYAQ